MCGTGGVNTGLDSDDRKKAWRIKFPDRNRHINREAGRRYNKTHRVGLRAKEFVKRHKIPLAEKCELCPDDDPLPAEERHHPDYALPQIVVSVCRKCHKALKSQSGLNQT